MIEALIVDDEKENIELVTRLLKKNCPSINILGSANTKKDAVELINNLSPNLIFMDVNLDGNHTGFDVLEEIDQLDAKVIFITSFDKYAIKAFDYNTIAYIVKPIKKSDLIVAVNKATQEIERQTFTDGNQINALRHTLDSPQIIAIPTIKDIELIKIKDIVYLSSDSRYTNFFLTGEKRIMSSKNLGKYEKSIQGNFYRIHSKYFVNLDYLKKIHKSAGSSYCEMETGDLLPISQRKYSDFMKFLQLK
ncbi:LytR/AlgR family response regulator transcription factor [Gelatiniphilus marinus]|uniref:LytR/AlgR family response regulator transcription factor n=1 Tax=Gelatiniphilus marinus TaxID=1759464 RepID=A0ABW5JUI9_9FLAO